MIKYKETQVAIDFPSKVLDLPEIDFDNLRKEEKQGRLIFIVPNRFVSNKDKTIYKIGWLVSFLQTLYPDTSLTDIFEIINKRYQVFLDRRAIERKLKQYADNAIFRE